MRHRKNKKVLDRASDHRTSMLKNIVRSVFEHGKIQTTEAKAKVARRTVERCITHAKQNTLSSRRRLIAYLQNPALVHKLQTSIAARYKDRPGGYTRIIKIGYRSGDSASTVYLTLV